MSNIDWDNETTRFLGLAPEKRGAWLASVAFALTVLARGAYAKSDIGVDEPERLRSFNELLHRVTSQLRDTLAGRVGRPDEVFVKLLTAALDEVRVNPRDLLAYLRSG